MAEVTRVWVRTSILDRIVYGKIKSTNERSVPGETGGSFDEDVDRNWGWARGEIVDEEIAGSAAGSAVGTAGGSGGVSSNNGKEQGIKVRIRDEDSNHDRNEISLPNSVIPDGNLVMANVYGHGEDEEDSNGEEDDYYDDYGGDSSHEDASSKYPDDLIILTHLHEPSVVYSLRKRYYYDKIYTATGPILIAINPFKHCAELYSDKVMQKYWNRGEQAMLGNTTTTTTTSTTKSAKGKPAAITEEEDNLPPHVYGIADHSFRTMMTKFQEFTVAQTTTGGASTGSGARRRPNTAAGGAGATKQGYNQSILVSGESGAGKTVTTKFIMQYLATLSKRCAAAKAATTTNTNNNNSKNNKNRKLSLDTGTNKVDIEQQVLQSNPILESFGNARTIRNDNSSRFGKFIEMQFTSGGSLIGASVQTYLLEKVRLVTQATGERNYHIFYEILQGMEEHDLQTYFLNDYSAEDFNMTNQSATFDRRDGVSDYDTYQELTLAMDTMGLETKEQQEMIAVPCALLHASNITFNGVTADECEIDRSNDHLAPVLSLLGVTADALNRALCYFSITAGREKHLRSLSKEKAEKGLLALIKATYGALFTHIVQRVNQSIASKDTAANGGRRGSQNTAAAYIGVLDIFGFESFRFNSFEQLCINYCNEALQQQFNLFVLKNEQEEYTREGIQWSFISFPDNQDVLDLIDKKGAGILNILDDQCRAPGTTDKTFVNNLYQKLSRHSRFQADFRQVGAKKFAIIHYAGTVEYSSETFVEKNRDELPKEATDLLGSSSNKFVAHLAEVLSGPPTNDAKAGNRARPSNSKLTVGGQFSRQLHELRQKIDETSPHYVRCLKPNDELVPDLFDPVVIADQLRCAGVIEAVRVSRVGYPQRYTHAKFVTRYRILGIKALKQAARSSRRSKPVNVIVQTIAAKIAAMDTSLSVNSSPTKKSSKISESPVDLVSVGIQVGKTKVFLRRKAYEVIEGLRNREMRGAAVKVQSLGRGYVVHREYNESQTAVVKIQSWARIAFAKRIVNEVRRHYNATLIQTAYRKFMHNRHYLSILSFSIWLQRFYRGRKGRCRYQVLNYERKSILIQKVWRLSHCRRAFQMKKSGAIVIQCAVRCRFARQCFRELRAKARDVSNIAEERDKLQVEIQHMRKAYDKACARATTAEEMSKNTSSKDEVEELRQEIDCLRIEVKQVYGEKDLEVNRAEDATKKATELTKQLEGIKNENENLIEQKQKVSALCAQKDQEILLSVKEVKVLKSKISSAQNDTNLAKEIKLLAKEMTSLLKENSSMKKTIALERKNLKSATQSCVEKDAEISTFMQEIKVLKIEIDCEDQLQKENINLKECLDSAQMDLEAATDKCDERKKEISSHAQEIEKLKTSLDNALADKDTHKQKGEVANKEIEHVRQGNVCLKEALEQTRCDLKAAISDHSPTSVDTSSEVTKLQKQNRNLQKEAIRLRGELNEHSIKTSASCDHLAALTGEIEILRKEKESLEENMTTLTRNVSIERRADEELDGLIHNVKAVTPFDSDKGRSPSPMFSVGSESYDDEDKEVLVLEEKVERLKKELEETRNSELKKSTKLLKEIDKMTKTLSVSKDSSTEEILTLQDEVQYLNDELRSVKEGNGSNPIGGHRNDRQDNQLGKLIDSIVAKDEEIRELRHEIAMLKDNLDSVTLPSTISEYPTMSHDDDDRSVVSRLFGRPPPSISTRTSPTYQLSNDKDYIAVKKINESLMKEVEELKKKCEDYRKQMEDERQQSEREIEAFGEALSGVDELRQAAETMSREITRLKNNPEISSNNEIENDPIHRMEKAKRTIDISALKSTQQNMWGTLTQSFRDPKPDNTSADDSMQKSSRRKRRTKRRDADDSSIFSAFF